MGVTETYEIDAMTPDQVLAFSRITKSQQLKDYALKKLQDRTKVAQAKRDAEIHQREASTAAEDIGMNINRGYKDAQGRPDQMRFQTLLDSSGLMRAPYRLDKNQLPEAKFDTRAVDEMRNQAMATDSSPWAKLQASKLQTDKMAQMDELRKAQGAQTAQMGSVSQGAREKMAMQSPLAKAGAVQNDFMTQSLGIGAQDQINKNALLKGAAQGDQMIFNAGVNNRDFEAQRQKFNIDNSLKDIAQRRAVDTNNYNEAMKAYSAALTADATASAKPGGKK